MTSVNEHPERIADYLEIMRRLSERLPKEGQDDEIAAHDAVAAEDPVLDDAIKHYYESAEHAVTHRQIAEWLTELKNYRQLLANIYDQISDVIKVSK